MWTSRRNANSFAVAEIEVVSAAYIMPCITFVVRLCKMDGQEAGEERGSESQGTGDPLRVRISNYFPGGVAVSDRDEYRKRATYHLASLNGNLPNCLEYGRTWAKGSLKDIQHGLREMTVSAAGGQGGPIGQDVPIGQGVPMDVSYNHEPVTSEATSQTQMFGQLAAHPGQMDINMNGYAPRGPYEQTMQIPKSLEIGLEGLHLLMELNVGFGEPGYVQGGGTALAQPLTEAGRGAQMAMDFDMSYGKQLSEVNGNCAQMPFTGDGSEAAQISEEVNEDDRKRESYEIKSVAQGQPFIQIGVEAAQIYSDDGIYRPQKSANYVELQPVSEGYFGSQEPTVQGCPQQGPVVDGRSYDLLSGNQQLMANAAIVLDNAPNSIVRIPARPLPDLRLSLPPPPTASGNNLYEPLMSDVVTCPPGVTYSPSRLPMRGAYVYPGPLMSTGPIFILVTHGGQGQGQFPPGVYCVENVQQQTMSQSGVRLMPEGGVPPQGYKRTQPKEVEPSGSANRAEAGCRPRSRSRSRNPVAAKTAQLLAADLPRDEHAVLIPGCLPSSSREQRLVVKQPTTTTDGFSSQAARTARNPQQQQTSQRKSQFTPGPGVPISQGPCLLDDKNLTAAAVMDGTSAQPGMCAGFVEGAGGDGMEVNGLATQQTADMPRYEFFPDMPVETRLALLNKKMPLKAFVKNRGIAGMSEGCTTTGLTNPENNCWLNALIQTLANLPPFLDFILAHNLRFIPVQQLKAPTEERFSYFKKKEGIGGLRGLIAWLTCTPYKSIDPRYFAYLAWIRFGFLDSDEIEQKDVGEAILKILNGISEVIDTSRDALARPGEPRQGNPIADMFHAIVRYHHRSQDGVSMHDAVLFPCIVTVSEAPDLLDALGLEVGCDGSLGSKYIFIKPPPVLVFLLNRSIYDVRTQESMKYTGYFSFPYIFAMDRFMLDEDATNGQQSKPLDLSLSCGEGGNYKHKYQLHSVIVHKGTHEAGHYYAIVKHPLRDVWIKYDDATVTPVSWIEVEHEAFGGHNKPAAHFLFYRAVTNAPEIDRFPSDATVLPPPLNSIVILTDSVLAAEATPAMKLKVDPKIAASFEEVDSEMDDTESSKY